jgi:NitT/TauT family transport system substrate-binding protein
LSTKLFNAGPSLVEALLAGEIDIGYVGPGPALNAQLRTRGRGIRVIAGAAANGVLIVARKGSGISSLSDLRGRKLATPQHGNTQDLSARHYLVSVLHQADDRNVLPVPNAEQSGMMARGQVDASWAPEPWGSRLMAETGATLVAEEKDLWPAKEFTLTVVVTTPEFLAHHPDVVEKVLRVHSRWTHRLQSEPKRYVPQLESALLGLTGKKLPKGVMASAIRRVKFTDDVLEDTFRAQASWSYELEFTVQPPSIAGLIDTRLLQKLRANNLGRNTGVSPALEIANTGETPVSR